jgi:hypothetical protein
MSEINFSKFNKVGNPAEGIKQHLGLVFEVFNSTFLRVKRF